jgi:aryl-alcohol dehydrogenase-like predicted oxidoreductase
MKTRRIGPFEVSAIGLGCMNLSHAYGTPPPAEAGEALLRGDASALEPQGGISYTSV